MWIKSLEAAIKDSDIPEEIRWMPTLGWNEVYVWDDKNGVHTTLAGCTVTESTINIDKRKWLLKLRCMNLDTLWNCQQSWNGDEWFIQCEVLKILTKYNKKEAA